ncbi:aminoglycoside phosphotransferase family protein [Streptomyces sp. ADI96-02]|uniref:aminoglycoside phosphotransferase family protein n=1 Tax=Streptomyces sp. ADI96-02 TaxID=1522760 RepID=UPI000F550542|nr:aminoglycoside phosphotransferase family protein [Streptomyces sp. ADI96-02]
MIDIPDGLVAAQSSFNGEAGRAFVAGLPGLAERYLAQWGLRLDGAAMHGMCALVLPVVRVADGLPTVLKLQALDEETVGEPVALRAWGAAGVGAVGLLDHDPDTGALLLERLDEQRPLSRTADVRAAVGVLGEVLARLAAVPAPEGLRTLGAEAERMLVAAPEAARTLADASDRRLLADCAAAVREVAGEPGDRLLHWDLHYDNVLSGRAGSERSGQWVAIDPKPLVGDPGFELFPALVNLFDAGEVLWRFDALTDALGMAGDRARARAWTLGRVLQNALGAVGDGERPSADQAGIARQLLGR